MCFILDKSSYLDLGALKTSEGVDGIDGDVYIPYAAMYGIFTEICLKFMVNVGEYTTYMDTMGI